jgi:3-methyl-2-oxobutanoate hydroxymethyltransferase
MEDVFTRYRDEVREHIYPGPEHTVYMPEGERKEFQAMMQWSPKEGGA